MVSDNELLDDVRTVLRAEVAQVTAPASLLATVRRRQARRRWTWLALPLAAAAAAAFVLVPPAEQPAPVPVAQVLERTNAALEGIRGNIVHETAPAQEGDKYFQAGERGLNERWWAADGSSFRFLATVDGRPVVDLSRSAAGDVFVDHRARTYRVRPGETPQDDVWTPEEIQKAISEGRITVRGPGEPVGGRPAVLLTIGGLVDTEMWVDAETYLPLRWRWMQERSSVFDVTWLPPTAENLALLKTPVPDGYQEMK